MESVDKKDFMTKGPIDKVIFSIAIPLMLNNLVRTMYNLTDGLFVARLSAEDFAATAFVWPLNHVFISLGIGIGIGATSLISQYLGGNQIDKANRYTDNTIFMIFILGLIMSFIGFFSSPFLLSLMGAEGDFLYKSNVYLKISFIGLFFDFCYFGYQALLNSEGNTKSITKMSLISSLVNVILDPILIFDKIPLTNLPGLGMGISGAAWATVISKVVLLILAIKTVKKTSTLSINYKNLNPNKKVMRNILKIALPSALGMGGASIGFTIMNGFIQSYGTNTLAAFSMGNRVSDLVTQPQMGIGQALTSIIGQNLGSKNIKRVKDIFKRAVLIIIIISILSSIFIIVFKSPLLSIFIKDDADPELWVLASEYLSFAAFIIFFMGLYSALNGFFQGIGQTKYTMYMSIGRLWLLRLPIIWFLGSFTSLGSTGIWIAMLGSNLLTVLYGFLMYRKIDLSFIGYKV